MLSASLQKRKASYPNDCPGYGTKSSDGEPPVLQYHFIGITPRFTVTQGANK